MATRKIRVLVPSSEKKRPGGSRAFTFREAQRERSMNRFSSLGVARTQALDAFLAAINGQGHAAEVLGLRGAALEEAANLNYAFHRSPLLPVLRREGGPLYDALLPAGVFDGMDPDDGLGLATRGPAQAFLRRLSDDLVIVCPLLGLLAPSDCVPEYRCPVGAQVPSVGSVHTFWKPHVTSALNRLCRDRVVFSFLPGRLRALWDDDGRAASIVSFHFVRRKGTKDYADNAGTARISGEIARFVFESGATSAEALQRFRGSTGHVLDASRSTLGDRNPRLVFVREL